VKLEINKQKLTDSFPLCFEGKLVKEHQELANMFNEYFVNMGQQINLQTSSQIILE